MPVYEYSCQSCNRQFEVMQKFSDPPLEKCEECGGLVRKLISNTSFVLKGTGWYVTDYARKNSNDGADKTGKVDKSDKGDKKDPVEGSSDNNKTASSESKTSSDKSNESSSNANSSNSSSSSKSEPVVKSNNAGASSSSS